MLNYVFFKYIMIYVLNYVLTKYILYYVLNVVLNFVFTNFMLNYEIFPKNLKLIKNNDNALPKTNPLARTIKLENYVHAA